MLGTTSRRGLTRTWNGRPELWTAASTFSNFADRRL
jgi:hypothetical protein